MAAQAADPHFAGEVLSIRYILAGWQPNRRTLSQTVILLNGYQTMSTLRDPAGGKIELARTLYQCLPPLTAPWNAAAIRLAQLMGLHELSKDSTRYESRGQVLLCDNAKNRWLRMLDDDAAVPKGDNQVKIQVGRRLWMSLVVL